MKKALKESDFWLTPKDIYDIYIRAGAFDPCPQNPTFDGLSIDWPAFVFCNPPYSQIQKWVDKAIDERDRYDDQEIVLLLPNWTDRKWFHDLDQAGFRFEFTRGRLKFGDPRTGLPGKYSPRFGSVYAVYENGVSEL